MRLQVSSGTLRRPCRPGLRRTAMPRRTKRPCSRPRRRGPSSKPCENRWRASKWSSAQESGTRRKPFPDRFAGPAAHPAFSRVLCVAANLGVSVLRVVAPPVVPEERLKQGDENEASIRGFCARDGFHGTLRRPGPELPVAAGHDGGAVCGGRAAGHPPPQRRHPPGGEPRPTQLGGEPRRGPPPPPRPPRAPPPPPPPHPPPPPPPHPRPPPPL